jgi:DNA-binding IclR family transcriptional regulator
VSQHSLPDAVVGFVHEHVASIGQLEILLLLRRRGGELLEPAAVARELAMDAGWVERELAQLASQGLIENAGNGIPAWRWAPRTPALEAAAAAVADAYVTHRVAVVTLVVERPNQRLRVFADAFRVRKDP